MSIRQEIKSIGKLRLQFDQEGNVTIDAESWELIRKYLIEHGALLSLAEQGGIKK